jgi:integrase
MTTITPITPDDNDLVSYEETIDLAEVRKRIENSKAPNTNRSYDGLIGRFFAYCRSRGWNTDPQTPEEWTRLIARFSIFVDKEIIKKGLGRSSVSTAISAMKRYVMYRSIDASLAMQSEVFSDLLTVVARERADRPVKKARPITKEINAKVHASLSHRGQTLEESMERAIWAFMFATASRSENLRFIRFCDITQEDSIGGFIVRLRKSKTDQTGQGRDIPVMRAKNSAVDPVRSFSEYREWLKPYNLDPESVIFAPLKNGKPVIVTINGRNFLKPVSDSSHWLTRLVRKALRKSGAVPEGEELEFSSHSARHGHITSAYDAGVSERDIGIVTGHKNVATQRGYDHSGVTSAAQTKYLE